MSDRDDAWYEKWSPGPGWPTSEQCKCPHENFDSDVHITRLVNDDGALSGIDVELNVRCSQCGLQLQFLGLPHAISDRVPTTDIMHCSASLPAKPFGIELAEPSRPPIEMTVTHTDFRKPGDHH